MDVCGKAGAKHMCNPPATCVYTWYTWAGMAGQHPFGEQLGAAVRIQMCLPLTKQLYLQEFTLHVYQQNDLCELTKALPAVAKYWGGGGGKCPSIGS